MPLGVAWYAHLPAIASRGEVRRHVESSLLPMLDAHAEHAVPVLLAPTGSFLDLATSYRPTIAEEIRSLQGEGLVEVAGTFYHEVLPLELPFHRLRRHLIDDVRRKSELFLDAPRWFVPANFAWRVGLGDLLVRHGIEAVLLDSRHAVAAGETHHWDWGDHADAPTAVVAEPGDVRPYETQRVRRLECPSGAHLNVVFRDWDLVRTLTFGNGSSLANGGRALRRSAAALAVMSRLPALRIVCDDVDRIRGETVSAYRTMLSEVVAPFGWDPDAPPDRTLPCLSSLPTWSIPGLDQALRAWEGGQDWSSLAEEVRAACERPACVDQALWFDDAFAYFWRRSSRRNRYVAQACRYLTEHYEGGHAGGQPGE